MTRKWEMTSRIEEQGERGRNRGRDKQREREREEERVNK